jgi:hypothetical protein
MRRFAGLAARCSLAAPARAPSARGLAAARGPPPVMGAIVDPANRPASTRRRRAARAAPAEDDADAWRSREAALRGEIAAAFAHLDDVAVTDDGSALHVELPEGRGTFSLAPSPDPNGRTVDLMSPVSGSQTYAWDAAAAAWKHVGDRHDLTGIIVRDYMRSGCIGLPKL